MSTNTAKQIGDSKTGQSEDQTDIDFVFHESRMIHTDETVTIRPTEVIVTPNIEDVDRNTFADDASFKTIDKVEKIPLEHAVAKLNIDGEERLVEMFPEHYIKFESSDLMSDIYVPINLSQNGSFDFQGLRNKYDPFVGSQEIKENIHLHISNSHNIGEKFDDVTIDDGEIEIPVEPTTEPEKKDSKTESLVKWIANTRFGDKLFSQKTNLRFILLTLVSIVATIVLSVFDIFGAALMAESDATFSFAQMTGAMTYVPMTIMVFMVILLGTFTHLYKTYKQITTTEQIETRTFEYQTERPNGATTLIGTQKDIDDHVDHFNVTASVDKERGVCNFHSINTDMEWDVDLENGSMSPELVTFFEQVGAERISDVFTIERRVYPDDNSIPTNTDGEYISPVNVA